MALFLNPEEIGDCFVEVLLFECPENNKLRKYCDYLTNNYMFNESLFSPKFQTTNLSELIRKTNKCESFHSFFNKTLYCNSPPNNTWLAVSQTKIQNVYNKLNSIH